MYAVIHTLDVATANTGSAPIILDLGLVLTFLISTVSPYVVALITREHWSQQLKAATLIAVSIATSVLSQVLDAWKSHTLYSWTTVIVGAIIAWITGHVSYNSLLKPTSLIQSLQSVGSSEDMGVGYVNEPDDAYHGNTADLAGGEGYPVGEELPGGKHEV